MTDSSRWFVGPLEGDKVGVHFGEPKERWDKGVHHRFPQKSHKCLHPDWVLVFQAEPEEGNNGDGGGGGKG